VKTAPAVSVRVTRFDRWRFVLALLWALAGAGMAATLAAHTGAAQLHMGLGAAAVALAAAAASLRASRRSAVVMAWDGRQWTVAEQLPAASPGAQQQGPPVRMSVHVDLGGWLLVRLDTEGIPARRQWLPLQRTGLEPQWHALRCALYSRAPLAAPVVAARADTAQRAGTDPA
jgi:hypothetical protein